MSMNPYEIRLDVLKLAQTIHEDKMRHDYNIASMATSNMNYALGVGNIVDVNASLEISKSLEKSYYTEQDVINTASKLYDFVQDRNGRKSDGG